MANSADALKWIRSPGVEGEWGCDPSDPGGETYRGWARKSHSTSTVWSIIDAIRGPVYPDTYPEVAALNAKLNANAELQSLIDLGYTSQYWSPYDLDNFPRNVALWIFDTVVQHGKGVQIIQTMLNADYQAGIVVDNCWGPATYGCVFGISSAPAPSSAAFCTRLRFDREDYYRKLATQPGQTADLPGWLNRLNLLQKFLSGDTN